MRRQLIETAALNVAEQIKTVEKTIDAALSEIAELQGRVMRARAIAPVGYRTGQEALQHLAETINALVSARGGVGNCHAALTEARSSVPGLRTVSFGDVTDCPPDGSYELRVVA